MLRQLTQLDHEQTELLDFVEELLRLNWTTPPADPNHAVHEDLTADLVVEGDRLAEAMVPLPDHEMEFLTALRAHFGPDIEIVTPRRRVHRWMVHDHELLLDASCACGCHLLVD